MVSFLHLAILMSKCYEIIMSGYYMTHVLYDLSFRFRCGVEKVGSWADENSVNSQLKNVFKLLVDQVYISLLPEHRTRYNQLLDILKLSQIQSSLISP